MAGSEAARLGDLVTFGVQATRPETGYGWLEIEGSLATADPLGPIPLRRFVEKPDAETAAHMLAADRFLWNSGIFLFSASAIIDAFEAHQPAMLDAVRAASVAAEADLAFLRLDPAAWAKVKAVSIDYAIMERAENLQVVPLRTAWSDLGAWDAVGREMETDEQGVARSGPALSLYCSDTLLRAESPNQVLVGVGLRDIAVVAMEDAVLVADLGEGQRIKEAVELLTAAGAPQATGFARCHRPWGWYETLSRGPRFQVKRIMVHPGGILSLQSHFHRAEHWVVVEGSARVTSGETVTLLAENQSIYIPLGTVHRLENPGKLDLHLIEVQSGSYLGEDDIVRYEDAYARP
jgi:mannose-1-phosphate guanylyltransferase / mannose-6-phosphate isomerase